MKLQCLQGENMFTKAGYYKLNGKQIWVQHIPKWGGLYWWTRDDSWQPLSEEDEKNIVFYRNWGEYVWQKVKDNNMIQIFTTRKRATGEVFEFYSLDEILHTGEEIEVWNEKENKGLGDPIIYSKARVIETPYHPAHLYKAVVLSGEKQ